MRSPAAAAAATLAIMTGCGAGSSESGLPQVVATTTQVEDLARNVAGERAEVAGLLAPNGDPHDYEPRPSDAQAVADAELVLRSGGDIDVWAAELVDAAGGEARQVELLAAIGADDGDPHWWQDPAEALRAVAAIRDELIAVDPQGAEDYRANAAAYIDRLRALDRAIASCIGAVPVAKRKLVTTHDAFGRFAEAYDLEVVGAAIPALTTQAQPSAGETAALVEQIDDQGVSAVFPESGVDAELEQAIADETRATVGSALWADTLGPEGSSGATYIEAMAHNAEAIASGLGARRCELDV